MLLKKASSLFDINQDAVQKIPHPIIKFPKKRETEKQYQINPINF